MLSGMLGQTNAAIGHKNHAQHALTYNANDDDESEETVIVTEPDENSRPRSLDVTEHRNSQLSIIAEYSEAKNSPNYGTVTIEELPEDDNETDQIPRPNTQVNSLRPTERAHKIKIVALSDARTNLQKKQRAFLRILTSDIETLKRAMERNPFEFNKEIRQLFGAQFVDIPSNLGYKDNVKKDMRAQRLDIKFGNAYLSLEFEPISKMDEVHEPLTIPKDESSLIKALFSPFKLITEEIDNSFAFVIRRSLVKVNGTPDNFWLIKDAHGLVLLFSGGNSNTWIQDRMQEMLGFNGEKAWLHCCRDTDINLRVDNILKVQNTEVAAEVHDLSSNLDKVRDLFNFEHDKLDDILGLAECAKVAQPQVKTAKQIATRNNTQPVKSASVEHLKISTPFFHYDSNFDNSVNDSRTRFLEFISEQGVESARAQLGQNEQTRMIGN